MDLSQFSDQAVTRRDGWSPELKIKFLDHLSAKGTVRSACSLVGMSHEAAYRLRRRDPLFARGWNAALALARDNGTDVLACRAIDGIEEHVWYRGELVGTRVRHDARLLLAHLARLDRLVEENPAGADAARFDELLAVIGGAEPPDWACGDMPPPDRASFIADVAEGVAQDCRDAGEAEEGSDDCMDDEAYFALDKECADEAERAGIEAAALWDEWFQRACGLVDGVAEFSPRTVSTLSTSGASSELTRHPELVSGSISAPAQVRPSGTMDAEASSA